MDKWEEDIKRYHAGEMTPEEQHALEKKALSDPFLFEALEGTESLLKEDFTNDLKEIELKINSRITERENNFGLAGSALASKKSAYSETVIGENSKIKAQKNNWVWPLEKYFELVQSLPGESYHIYVTGLQEEGDLIRNEKPELLAHPNVTDLTGKFNLTELTSFISQADGLLACSTGVLHLAAALGIHTLGLYAPMKPIHPGRWMPVGKRTKYLVLKKECNECRASKECACINAINTEEVKQQIDSFKDKKFKFAFEEPALSDRP